MRPVQLDWANTFVCLIHSRAELQLSTPYTQGSFRVFYYKDFDLS